MLKAWVAVDMLTLCFEAPCCNPADHSHRRIKCRLIICFQHQRLKTIIRIGRSNSSVYSCTNYCLSWSKWNQSCYSLDPSQNVVWLLRTQDVQNMEIIDPFNCDDFTCDWIVIITFDTNKIWLFIINVFFFFIFVVPEWKVSSQTSHIPQSVLEATWVNYNPGRHIGSILEYKVTLGGCQTTRLYAEQIIQHHLDPFGSIRSVRKCSFKWPFFLSVDRNSFLTASSILRGFVLNIAWLKLFNIPGSAVRFHTGPCIQANSSCLALKRRQWLWIIHSFVMLRFTFVTSGVEVKILQVMWRWVLNYEVNCVTKAFKSCSWCFL